MRNDGTKNYYGIEGRKEKCISCKSGLTLEEFKEGGLCQKCAKWLIQFEEDNPRLAS